MGPIPPERLPTSVAEPGSLGFIQLLPTPPLPTEALSVLSPPHVTRDLLFYLVLDEAEAFAGMSNREVAHPTAQDRVDQLNDQIHWLRLVAAEYVFELPQQRSSFLELGRVAGTPYTPTTTDMAGIETQEAEALASTKVHVSTLLLFDLDLQLGKLFPESFLRRVHSRIRSGSFAGSALKASAATSSDVRWPAACPGRGRKSRLA
jgi:hypothetical protein